MLIASPQELSQTSIMWQCPGIHPSLATCYLLSACTGEGSACADSSLTEAQAGLEDVCSPLQAGWWLDAEQPSFLDIRGDSTAGSPNTNRQQERLHQTRTQLPVLQGRLQQLVH